MQIRPLRDSLSPVMRASAQTIFLVALVSLLFFISGTSRAQEEETPESCRVIKEIEVRGNSRMSADAVRFDLGIKKGSNWDPAAISREYGRFWRRGFFSDLRFFRRCEPDGAVLVVEIRERPSLLSVTYEKNKEVSQQQIEDHFKQRTFSLPVGAAFDRKKIWRAESLIKELLESKGFSDAQVKGEIRETSSGSRAVTFRILPGGKAKIRQINFTGNTVASDRVLRNQLKLTKPWRFYWPFGSKIVYHPLKLQEDLPRVTSYYRDLGYLDADYKPPIVELKPVHPEKAAREAEKRAQKAARKAEKARLKDKAKGKLPELTAPAGSKALDVRIKKWAYISIPIVEGKAYTLGQIKFEGNTLFKEDLLRAVFPIRPGGLLSDSRLEVGLDNVRALYGRKGHVYAAVTRRFERKENGEPVADVVISIDEDQAYTIRRIEFRGNTQTNDAVLRRELTIREGEVLDKAKLDLSMQKLHNLQFWMPAEEATLEPVKDRAEVDVKISGEEQNRNEIQIGGGYSEMDGGFFSGSFSTKNFLGRGETLDLMLMVGSRFNRSSIGFTEPYFLGKPYLLGFQIFRRTYDYGRSGTGTYSSYLSQTSTGGQLTVGKFLGNFSRVQITYSYENIKADTSDLSSTYSQTSTRLGSVYPVFSYKNVNNPMRPTRGQELNISPQITARAFGSNTNFLKPTLAFSIWRPLSPKLFFGLHMETAALFPFGERKRDPGFVDYVPRFERFFLGGDTYGPRVFESRTISPIRYRALVDNNGNGDPGNGIPVVQKVWVGGNKMLLTQFELGVPIGKTATFAAFFDAGGVYDNGQRINTKDMRMSAGVEFRIFLQVFQAPIRLIYGWPIRKQPEDQTNKFQFSVGLPF